MTNEMKLLRAFIEAQGYEIEATEDIKRIYLANDVLKSGELKQNAQPESVMITTDYKVTMRAKAMMLPILYTLDDGALFSLGCQCANDDIKGKLKLLGFDLDKNQMHDVMETIIFHIAR